MRGELVALDLETTGLDSQHDAIIEIGAVRLQDGTITSEFSTLVNPGSNNPISPHITHITGIHPEDIVGAPTIDMVLPEIQSFVGNAPIIAHNISFDIGFFQPHGILQENTRIDTYELASVLLPSTPRYNLNSLTTEFDIELEHAHRALDDARATALLYWELWRKTLTLPYTILNEIVRAASGINWNAREVFQAALEEHKPSTDTIIDQNTINIFGSFDKEVKPLQPNESLEKLHTEEIATILQPGGLLSQMIPNYEFRPQQAEMTSAIVKAINQSQHIMIEAGTGIGKTFAYLIPAIIWAVKNNERVVISTNTINLQSQLIQRDIPNLRKILATPFEAAILKGRSNYLCPQRLAALRHRQPTSTDELRMLAKILVWLLECKSGEKSDITLRGSVEHTIWQQLSADDESCVSRYCETMMQGRCPFYKAQKAAEMAHLVVVNHALLISDALVDNHILPHYNYLIIDEAHHLEDAVTNGLSFQIDKTTLRRRLTHLGSPTRGVLGHLLTSVRDHIPTADFERLSAFIKNISDATATMLIHVDAFFNSCHHFLIDTNAIQSYEYTANVLITHRNRSKPAFAQLQATWTTLDEFFEAIAEATQHLTTALKKLAKYDIPNFDDLHNSTGAIAHYLNDARGHLSAFILAPDPNTIYWFSNGQSKDYITIHTAPLHIGALMDNYIWRQNESVIMTSATLRTYDSFAHISERLSALPLETLELGSPFNYPESTLVFIPNDIPEPANRHAYQQAVERGLIELATALDGRVLGLFTSYTQLRQTAQAITPRLALGNINVYTQSDGTSREALLEGFKTTEKAVLLGTKSFWEGVDIPGESLSALVIVRLPFAVPSDPIFAARSETYADSFNEYALPDAILRFRQGFGRLIRTNTDRGIVAIFDSRIVSKGYGTAFLQALPDCTVQHGSLDTLAESAKSWLTPHN